MDSFQGIFLNSLILFKLATIYRPDDTNFEYEIFPINQNDQQTSNRKRNIDLEGESETSYNAYQNSHVIFKKNSFKTSDPNDETYYPEGKLKNSFISLELW